MRLKITRAGKILQKRGNHNHEAVPALIQVQKLEAEKMEEILKNPETATAKNLLLSISEEILNPEMAAFASSYNTISKKLHRRLKKMKEVWSVTFAKIPLHIDNESNSPTHFKDTL